MLKKERVLAAINHKETDIVPYNIELCSETMTAFEKKYGIGKNDFFDFAGNHIEKISYNGGSYIGEGLFKDEFNVIWNRKGKDKDIGVITDYLISDEKSYVFPQPDLDLVGKKTADAICGGRDCLKLGKIGMFLFERAWSLYGMENLLADMILNEDFVFEIFDKITEYNLKIINKALSFNIDGFYFGDDYGQQSGLIMGDKLWRKFIKPNLAKAFKPIKEKQLPVFLHSCGNISDILSDLIDIGLDVYQTVQPEIYDLKMLKKKFGDNLSFFGGLSTQRDLPYIKPKDVPKLIKDTISVLGKNGGYICAPTHQVPYDVDPEVIMAMIECLKNQKNQQSQKI